MKSLQTANQKLKESDKIQKEFINVAAHELRTPIQPILGLSEFLQSKIKSKDERELVDTITRNAKRLHRLTEDILDATKIESQSLQLQKEKFNLNEVIMSVLADYESLIRKITRCKGLFYAQGRFSCRSRQGKIKSGHLQPVK